MPPVSIRKAKKVTVLTKRTQHLRKYFKERSHKPLFDKLKSNNNYLAKALANEKQNNQSLFSQNLALIAEVQNLKLACNKRNSLISNVVNNAKEMLKMVVTMSSYVTNTISMCQELTSSDTTARLSSTSNGRKESFKRLSKSPTKGVVKPMVGGHTITKPTINLSRVNISRLSNISEVSEISPNNSQEINAERSPIILPLPTTPLRCENSRACRMPERITVSSPRISDTLPNEPRRRRRSRHSKNLSESYSRSRSNRWSEINETPKNCSGHINIGSPTVKLKDVSKLLKDSHTINIRRLIDSKIEDIEIQESSDETPHNTPNKNAILPETQISINLDDDETYAHKSKKEPNVQTNSKGSNKDFNRSLSMMEISRVPQSSARNWEEDPLEGPSWLFNNTVTMPSRDNEPEELGHLNISDVNNNTAQVVYDDSSDAESVEESSLPNLTQFANSTQGLERNAPFVCRSKYESFSDYHDADDNFHVTAAAVSTREKFSTENNEEDSMASFVTIRRGHSKLEDETEDFTLMLRPMKSKMQFDINELRLPEEECTINSTIDHDTSAVMNTPISSVSSVNLNDSRNDQVTMKSSTVLIDNHEKASIVTLEQKSHSIKKSKKTKAPNLKDEINNAENSVSTFKNKRKQWNDWESNRDPSAAKVVLEKLNESRVKPKIDDAESRNSHNNHMRDATSHLEESSGESESSHGPSCPKRRKAPISLKEPSLKKKLRRNQ
ncbi:uncharacterized protein [Linepithema humile]|uniref:uncharacterized protein n=1 Tax=Linepithema humile TaxID=83485 RepID=UPI0006239BC8|nr:PREDICTED: uncharacterized protein LOC105671638 [Linepithema humile]